MAASDAAMARRNEDYVISGESKLLHINDLSSNMDKLRGLFNVFEQKTELLHLLDAGRTRARCTYFCRQGIGIGRAG